MSHLYDRLRETSIKLTSISILVIAISIYAIHLVELYHKVFILASGMVLSLDLAKAIVFTEVLYALKIILIVYVSTLIGGDTSRGVEGLHNSVRRLVLLSVIYLLVMVLIARVLELRAYLHGITAPEAFYISLIVVLIVAYFMKRTEESSIGGRVLRAIGYTMETAVFVVLIANIMFSGFPYLEYPSLMFITPSSELIISITTYTILHILFNGLEIVVLKIASPSNVFSAIIHLIRKITILIASIVIGSILVVYATGFAQGLVGLFAGFEDIKSSFVFLLFISTLIFVIGLVVGIIAGILYLVVGLRSRSLFTLSAAMRELSEKPTVKPESKIEVPAETKPEPQRALLEERAVEEKIKCSFCGAEIPRTAKFCPNCGAYLQEEEGTRVYSTK